MRRQGTSENNTTLSLRDSSMIKALSICQDSDIRNDQEDKKEEQPHKKGWCIDLLHS